MKPYTSKPSSNPFIPQPPRANSLIQIWSDLTVSLRLLAEDLRALGVESEYIGDMSKHLDDMLEVLQ